MSDLTVTQNSTGGAWDVVDAGGTVLASFPTNAQAWRYIDRHHGEPVSRGESVSAWVMGKIGTDDREGVTPRLRGPSVRDRLRRRQWRQQRRRR